MKSVVKLMGGIRQAIFVVCVLAVGSAAALVGGMTSVDSPQGNAIVAFSNSYYGVGCTGTLVAPDVILTAGHCVMGLRRPDGNGDHPLSFFDGGWHPLPSGQFTINFGPDRNNPIHVVTATWFSSPPMLANGGHDDIALIGLNAFIPDNIALPRAIAFDRPASISTVWMYGFGGSNSYRQDASGRNYRDTDTNYAEFALDNGAYGEPGDSGGAILHGSTDGPLIGVVQRVGNTIGGVQTFGTGSAVKPDVRAWLQRNVLRSFCSRTASPVSRDESLAMLYHWWSGTREDNFVTTQAAWVGCNIAWDYEVDSEGYGFWRKEGWILRSAAAGTEPLYLFWNATSRDNATTTWDTRPGSAWSYTGLEGYVYTSPGTDRIPLRLWYSASRDEYFTTSNGQDYWSSGYQDLGIIGYVLKPELVR
jgi:hypothetical protein